MAASAGAEVAKQAQLSPLWPKSVSKAGVECKGDSALAALQPTYVGVSGGASLTLRQVQ